MNGKLTRLILGLTAAAMPLLVVGCSSKSADNSGTTGTTTSSVSQNGTVSMMMQDASTEDWATIGVRLLSISLVPQSGGSAATVYTAPSPAPLINLVQLDQLSEILGNASVPAGTYTAAALTISGNSGDVILTAAADPEAGFAGTAGATIPASQIQIQGAKGSAESQAVSLNVNFVSPLVVTANQSNALDLEFDLSHPSFLVAHVPVGGGTTLWAVNFNGPVRHHPIYDMRRLVLRDLYGNVNSVSTDDTSITITKDYAVEPPTTPETAIASSQTVPILADATKGSIFYDVDAKTHTTIMNFTAEANSLTGKYVRIAARYQANGSLVAVRIWASSSFNSVWLSPEGHVLHVNNSTDVITVENESGAGVPLAVDANTQFFFRAPANPAADGTPIGTGTASCPMWSVGSRYTPAWWILWRRRSWHKPSILKLLRTTAAFRCFAYDDRLHGYAEVQYGQRQLRGHARLYFQLDGEWQRSHSPAIRSLDSSGGILPSRRWLRAGRAPFRTSSPLPAAR